MALKYSKNWSVMDKNSDKYIPTKEREEKKVREDMQRLFDDIQSWTDGLNGQNGANEVGFVFDQDKDKDTASRPNNVNQALEYVLQQIKNAVIGAVADNTISEGKLTEELRGKLSNSDSEIEKLENEKLNKQCSDFFLKAFNFPSGTTLEYALVRLFNEGKTRNRTITLSSLYTVPEGITNITAFLIGGGGAGGSIAKKTYYYRYARCPCAYGGKGGSIVVTKIAVTPGEELDIVIGSGGNSEAKNGGATQIRRKNQDGTYTVIAEAAGGLPGESAVLTSPSKTPGSGDKINAVYGVGENPNEKTWNLGLAPSGAGAYLYMSSYPYTFTEVYGTVLSADPKSEGGGSTTISGNGVIVQDASGDATGGAATGYGAGGGGAVCTDNKNIGDTGGNVYDSSGELLHAFGGNGAPGIVMIYT